MTDEAAAILGGDGPPPQPRPSPRRPFRRPGRRRRTRSPDAAVAPDVVDAEDLIAEPVRRESPYDRPGDWYVVHTQSGYENKVKSNVESRIGSMGMEDSIFEVVIPMEDVIEFKGGKKVVVSKKVYPGYLYLRCFLDDRSWDVIRNTPGVTGFVGTGGKPVPLSRADVESALSHSDEADGPAPASQRPKLEYEVGESVRVRQGPSPTSPARSPRSTRISSR